MSIKTGTYIGNDDHQAIEVGFRPEVVIACAVTLEQCGIKIEDFWCGRSNVLSASDSYISGAKFTDKGFTVGPAATWNKLGTTYHYLALSRSAALKIGFAGLQKQPEQPRREAGRRDTDAGGGDCKARQSA